MAQHYCAKDKFNRGGCISPTDLDLLRDRRLEGPRFHWQQDTGRARCGANDCLSLSEMANTRYIFKGEFWVPIGEVPHTHSDRVKSRFRGWS